MEERFPQRRPARFQKPRKRQFVQLVAAFEFAGHDEVDETQVDVLTQASFLEGFGGFGHEFELYTKWLGLYIFMLRNGEVS